MIIKRIAILAAGAVVLLFRPVVFADRRRRIPVRLGIFISVKASLNSAALPIIPSDLLLAVVSGFSDR